MKLLFRQRLFSWFDSYDIYAEDGVPVYQVKGRPAWGHRLEIYDTAGRRVGTVREELLRFLPTFTLYDESGRAMGTIRKELTLLRPAFQLSCNGWRVTGDLLQWDYQVVNPAGDLVMTASKRLLNLTDTYEINVVDPANSLLALMIVLAIDAAKCSKNS